MRRECRRKPRLHRILSLPRTAKNGIRICVYRPRCNGPRTVRRPLRSNGKNQVFLYLSLCRRLCQMTAVTAAHQPPADLHRALLSLLPPAAQNATPQPLRSQKQWVTPTTVGVPSASASWHSFLLCALINWRCIARWNQPTQHSAFG